MDSSNKFDCGYADLFLGYDKFEEPKCFMELQSWMGLAIEVDETSQKHVMSSLSIVHCMPMTPLDGPIANGDKVSMIYVIYFCFTQSHYS